MASHKFTFPIGYHEFHKDQAFNFQLNRWYSIGYAKFEDMATAGKNIQTYADWKREMIALAEKAVSEDRLMNAAFYFRAAEFFLPMGNPEKERLYDKFINLFYKVFKNEDIQRHEIPYQKSYLPAWRIPPIGGKKKGTIVMFGGFDSFMEEFYAMIRYFSDSGYEVISFEGPGQGAALKKYGLPMDYEWEKPTKAVLDYFNLDDITLLGMSMGAWYVVRAAAFEPRVKRVMVSGPVYDYMKPHTDEEVEALTNWMNTNTKETIQKVEGHWGWFTNNLMYITKKETPGEAFKVILQLNEKNLHSELVNQDVLILTGRNDHFNPFAMHDMQVKALINAKSVTPRVFTKEEHADNHCQVGNIGLSLEVMVKWIEEKS